MFDEFALFDCKGALSSILFSKDVNTAKVERTGANQVGELLKAYVPPNYRFGGHAFVQ